MPTPRAGRERGRQTAPRLVAALGLGLASLCMGFEWPGRVAHLKDELARGDAAARRHAVRRLGAYPADEVREPLLAALEDDDVQVRLLAAAAVGRAGVVEALGALVPWLADRDPEVRIAAVQAVGALADPGAQEALTRALSDALPSVRRAAADALAGSADPEAQLALQSAIDDADPSVRDAVIRALRGRADGRALPALTRRVRDESVEVRIAVMDTLGASRDQRALHQLVQGARDPDDEVELRAILALGELDTPRDPAGLALLRDKLDGEPRVAKAALSALGRIDDATSLAALTAALARPELGGAAKQALLERVRRRAARAAPNAAEPQLLEAIAEALAKSDRPETVRLAAELAGELSDLCDTSTLHAPLSAALREGRGEPAALARALALTRAPEALVPLLERLSRPDLAPDELDRLLDAVLAYFTHGLRDGRAADPLLARLELERRTDIRIKLVQLIGWTGAARALPALRRELDAHDRRLRLASATALGRIASAESYAALDALATSPEPELRMAAARALAPSVGPAEAAQLLARLDGGGAADRGALLVSLGLALGRLRSEGTLTGALERSALSSLARHAASADAQLAARALSALRHLRHPDSPRALAHEFQSPRLPRRAAATFALGSFPGEETRRLLRYTLQQNSSARTTLAAALALGEVGDERDVPALARLLRSSHWPLPAATSHALRRIAARATSRKRALERVLCGLTDHPAGYVRANLASALGALAARCDGLDPRRWLAPDEPSAVRAAAGYWLWALAHAEAAPDADAERALHACASDPDRLVRAACSGASRGALHAEHSGGAWAQIELDLLATAAGDEATPLRDRLIAVRLPDTSVFVGHTDANGELYLPSVPTGAIALEDPGETR